MQQSTQKPIIQSDPATIQRQMMESSSFFGTSDLDRVSVPEAITNNPYANQDGLVEFILGTKLVNDPAVRQDLMERKQVLQEAISIVTRYVDRDAEASGQDHRTDLNIWEQAFSRFPLLTLQESGEQVYDRWFRGVSIPANLVELILGITPTDSMATNNFRQFLGRQGELIRQGIEQNERDYRTITVAATVVINRDLIPDLPVIHLFQANFNRSNSEWISSCASAKEVVIRVPYRYASYTFNYNALQNPNIKRSFDDFLQRTPKAAITDASTYFNEDFPV